MACLNTLRFFYSPGFVLTLCLKVSTYFGYFNNWQKKYYNIPIAWLLKGNLRSKNKLSSNERGWKMQKNEPSLTSMRQNGSRDIPSQSQEFEQIGRRHFVGFQPRFHVNMTAQTQSGKTMKKWKCNISAVFCSICLKFCRLLELSKEISLDIKFRCYGNQIQNSCLLLKKQ